MCLHIPLEEGGDGEGNVQSTSCCVSRLPVRRHRGSIHADALYIAERESTNVWRKRSSVPRSPALLAVCRAGQQTRPTATPSLDPYAQAASGSPGFVGKQDADLPVGGGLCWRGDTCMRGELDRGDRESVQRAPRIPKPGYAEVHCLSVPRWAADSAVEKVGILDGGGASPTLVTGSYIFRPAARGLNLKAGYYPQGGRDS